MQNLSQEHERLWSKNPTKIQNSVQYISQQIITDPFLCNYCHSHAHTPVVSHCGHIYCWRCIRQKHQQEMLVCATCDELIAIQEMRPIYLAQDHNPHTMDSHSRPKPKNKQPILNISGIGSNNSSSSHQNNISIGAQLAGPNYLPATFPLCFVFMTFIQSNFQQEPLLPYNKQQNAVSSFTTKLLGCLILLTVITLLGILVVKDKY